MKVFWKIREGGRSRSDGSKGEILADSEGAVAEYKQGNFCILVYACPRQMFRTERIYPFGADRCRKDKVNTRMQEFTVRILRQPLAAGTMVAYLNQTSFYF